MTAVRVALPRAGRAHRAGSGYFALKFQAWIKPETKSDWAARFACLNSWQLSELAKDFAYANKHTRILDEVRFAYYQANGKDPDDRALRNFDPVRDEQLQNEYRELSLVTAATAKQTTYADSSTGGTTSKLFSPARIG